MLITFNNMNLNLSDYPKPVQQIMNLLNYLTNTVSSQDPLKVPKIDTTLYYIKTKTKTHEGHVIYQNDVIIKLLSLGQKSVTILKSNINDIKVVKAAA